MNKQIAPTPLNQNGSAQEHIDQLEQALEATRSKLAFYEQLLATMNDAVVVIDAAGCIQEWNAAAERIYGWSAQEANGRLIDDLIEPRYLDGTSRVSAMAAVERDGMWTGTVAQRHRDGREVLVYSAVRPLRDAHGNITGMIGINRDVTDRAAAETALMHSEANLRALFESELRAQYLLDTNYTVIAFNRVTRRDVWAIWNRDIAVGDSILDFVNPNNRELFIEHYQRCLKGEPSRYERYVSHPNGISTWYELTYIPIYDNGSREIIGVAFSGSDISARKSTELTLARREAQLGGIIDSAMDAIITVDAEQKIVLFNNAAEQLFGCSAADVLGHSIDQFIPAESRSIHQHHVAGFGSAGMTRRSMHLPNELSAIRADGTRFPIEATISQITVAEQKFFTVILRDITERKRLESELVQSQKMESIGRLAGGIAHDFNNLLTVILGTMDLTSDTLPADHPAQKDLQEVTEAARRAAALTRQLLAFARKQVLVAKIANINAIIHETEQLLNRLIGEDIALRTVLDPNLLPVKADPNQIQQVLINLAVNARDAMPLGGQLTITTENTVIDAEMARTLNNISPGPYICITIADTGIGMSADVLSHLFEPFFTTKAPGKGTGLGLATSYGIIRQHGGIIWVDSTVGAGTAMYVYLPVATDVHAPGVLPEALEETPRGSEMILLAEDDEAVRNFAARVLRGLGYTVIEAGTGQEALRIARTNIPIHMLLTDVVMPEMDGASLAAALNNSDRHLKVLFMSGHTEHASLDHERLPADAALLQKPFDRMALAQKVRATLDM